MDGNYSSDATAGVTKWTLGEADEDSHTCAICRGPAKWSLTNKTLMGSLLQRFYCWGDLLKIVGLRTVGK